MKIKLAILFCLFSSMVLETDLSMNTAVLRGLDKVTGRMQTFEIPVGGVGQFGKTFIVPESCFTRPPEESPENSAFLYVYEKSLKGENIELFKGWMFSSNPALSSMEDPVYDIWVVACVNKDSEEKKPVEPSVPIVSSEEKKVLLISPSLSSEGKENIVTTENEQREISSQNLVPSLPVIEELPLSE